MSNSFSVESMADALVADKNKSGYTKKLYKELSDEHKERQIEQSIVGKAAGLKQAINAPKVNLADTKLVQERAFMYLDACAISSSFPSVMGLACAMGCSRQNLNRWLATHPEHETTNFVNMVKDVMADVLTNASLFNSANAVQVIFQLKNHFEHADRVEIAPVTPNRFEDKEIDVEEIRKRYMLEESRDKEDL